MMEQMAMKEKEGAPEERGRSPGGVSQRSSTFVYFLPPINDTHCSATQRNLQDLLRPTPRPLYIIQLFWTPPKHQYSL